MRKVKIETWKSAMPKRDEEGKVIGQETVDEDLLMAMNVLIANKKPEQMPRGLDKFRTFNRLNKAFEKAKKTKELVLEEAEYKFLKDTIESDIPATWGMNSNLNKAFEDFLSAKEVGTDDNKGSNGD